VYCRAMKFTMHCLITEKIHKWTGPSSRTHGSAGPLFR